MTWFLFQWNHKGDTDSSSMVRFAVDLSAYELSNSECLSKRRQRKRTQEKACLEKIITGYKNQHLQQTIIENIRSCIGAEKCDTYKTDKQYRYTVLVDDNGHTEVTYAQYHWRFEDYIAFPKQYT